MAETQSVQNEWPHWSKRGYLNSSKHMGHVSSSTTLATRPRNFVALLDVRIEDGSWADDVVG